MTVAREDWTLGAVFDERQLDAWTRLFVARADAPPPAARDLERRLIAAREAGSVTVVVDLTHSSRASAPLVAALTRADRKLAARNGGLVVDAQTPEIRHTLECAGLELSSTEPDRPSARASRLPLARQRRQQPAPIGT